MRDEPRVWRLGVGRELPLDVARVMGIVNVTPDSFSDGGEWASVGDAVAAAARMIEEGAEVIDVGGESTRPGAARVDAAEQVRRVVPVISGIRSHPPTSVAHPGRGGGGGGGVIITVDTTLAEVAEAAIGAGADGINDVSAGMEDAGMFALAAERGVGIVLMHRMLAPGADVFSHQYAREPVYEGGVVECVKRFLGERAAAAMGAGIAREAIVLDPGLGFGKSVAQNLELIERTGEIGELGFPVLSGLSRKSFTAVWGGMRMDAPARERVGATVELSVRHLRAGARVFRVHDVREHVEALRDAE